MDSEPPLNPGPDRQIMYTAIFSRNNNSISKSSDKVVKITKTAINLLNKLYDINPS